MRYVCIECGKILEEYEAIKNPDGEANCSDCYDETKWFDVVEVDEQKKPSYQRDAVPDDDRGIIRRLLSKRRM